MLSHGVYYPVILSAHFKEDIIMKIDVVKMSDVATVDIKSKVENGSEYPLFGFAIEAFIDKIVKYINNGYAIGVLLEEADVADLDLEKHNELVVVLKALNERLVIIGFEEGLEVDYDTLDDIKDAVCEADLDILEGVYEDRIVALDDNKFFNA
jgi:hypothetical protein